MSSLKTAVASAQILLVLVAFLSIHGCKVFSGGTSDGSTFDDAFKTAGVTPSASATPAGPPLPEEITPPTAVGKVHEIDTTGGPVDDLRAKTCYPLNLTAIGESTAPIRADEEEPVVLRITNPTNGHFYEGWYCAGDPITQATFAPNDYRIKISYQADSPGKLGIYANYGAISERATWGGIFYAPKVIKALETHSGGGDCVGHTFTLYTATGPAYNECLSTATSLNLHQYDNSAAGGTTKALFYSNQSDCLNSPIHSLITDASFNSEILVRSDNLPHGADVTVYAKTSGVPGHWTFTADFFCHDALTNIVTSGTLLDLTVEAE